jgi:hypothetical protein
MIREKGSALIMALIISVIMMALGLAVTFASLSDFSMSEEFEGHKRALYTAETGLADCLRDLRRLDVTAAISTDAQVPVFVSSGPSYYRDPVDFLEARSVDYGRLPSSVGQARIRGLMTPGLGTIHAPGRFIARISDNDDGDGDFLTDVDNKFFVRVAGIVPGPPQQLSQYGSLQKNSVAMIEAYYKRDMSLDVGSPFTVYGPDVNPARNTFFDGNSFTLDGYDHSGMSIAEIERHSHHHNNSDASQAGLSVLNDAPSEGDGQTSLDKIHDTLASGQEDNIEGADGPWGSSPSMRDDTDTVRNSGNEDATNVFDAYFLSIFIARVSAAADIVYPDGTSLSGGSIQLGTEDNPQIVVAQGDLDVSGNGSGCGLLIVKGELNYSGGFNYDGLILVVGDGSVNVGGANKSIIGGLYLARLEQDANGDPTFGAPSFTLGGNSNFYFRGDSIRMAMNLLPPKQLGWREITPEISVAAH